MDKKLKWPVLFITCMFFLCAGCTHRGSMSFDQDNNSFKADTLLINTSLKKIENHTLNNNDSIIKYLAIAESLSQKNGFQAGYAEALFQHGNYLYNKNDYSPALNYYNRALEIAKQNELILIRAKCLERMASVNLATGDANLALKLYYESLPLFEKVKDKRGIAKVYNIIGTYKTNNQVYDTAELYFNKAIELNKQIGDNYAIIENKGNMGSLYEHTNRISEAEKLYLDLAAELESMNDELSLPVIYYDLFSLYQNKDSSELAIKYLYKGMAISEKTHDTAMLADMYADAGEVLLEEGKSKDARMLLQKSIQCSQAIHEARTQIHVLMLLAGLDSASGDYRSAFHNIMLIPVLKDTVYKRKLRNNLKSSELQYENEQMQHHMEMQKLENEKGNRVKRNIIILLLLLTVIAIMITTLMNLKRRNLRKKLMIKEQELRLEALENEKKQNQLEISRLIIINSENERRLAENQMLNLSLSVKQKTDLLEDISKKLKVQTGDQKDNESALQQIISQIGSHKAGLNEANLFNERFSALHPDFFKSLKRKHPSLTKTELNFCAYLKIHLSSKQIAALLNVGPEAIRKTRYRIRKKLGLTASESLEDFVSGF